MTTLRRWLRDGRWLWSVGGWFSGWHLAHLFARPEALGTPLLALLSTLGPTVASLAIVAVGLALGERWGTESLRRVGRWVVLGAVAAACLDVLTLLYFRASGVAPSWSWHLVSNSATGGALGGVLVGVYDARAVRIAGRLRDEHRRVEGLNQRLRVLNRVLRHDLRNDANVIHGYASLLADDADPEVSRRADVIRRKANELTAFSEHARDLERLLADDRIEAGGQMDLAAVVARRLDALERAHPDARIRREIPDRARVVPVALLDAVVDAVVENAVVHNDADRPLVSVSVRASGAEVVLSVADDGPGIPDVERRVFDAGTETPLRHSNGLGLWVVQWAVGEAGGTVDIGTREEGRGSVVAVTLPREMPDGAANAASGPNRTVESTETDAADRSAAVRVVPLLHSLRGESK